MGIFTIGGEAPHLEIAPACAPATFLLQDNTYFYWNPCNCLQSCTLRVFRLWRSNNNTTITAKMSARVDSPALRELYYGQVTYVSHPGTNVVIFFKGKKKNAETVTAPAFQHINKL